MRGQIYALILLVFNIMAILSVWFIENPLTQSHKIMYTITSAIIIAISLFCYFKGERE